MTEPRDHTLQRPDGRTVAWTDYGDTTGRPVLRMPGTPGSRWGVRADRTPWDERGLRVITTERPGYGASTRLPDRGFTEHADDLAAVLDEIGLERVFVTGGSGGGPHVLAFCARHPERVIAATILVGVAPLEPAEAASMIGLNQQSWQLCTAGDRDGEVALLEPVRQAMLADPLAAFRTVMASAPEDDQAVMADPNWQASFARGTREALTVGVDGWVDESMALTNRWDDIELTSIAASITWFHAAGDRNCPLPAVRRLVEQLPTVRLQEWPHDVGHL